jgi:putative transposase
VQVFAASLGDNLETELALRALNMELAQRIFDEPLMHHSDRSCQYTSAAYLSAFSQNGITVSMSRQGNFWDDPGKYPKGYNAVAESFFATLKKELVHRQEWATRAEVEAAVFEYIETYYNHRRLHSSLGFRTPMQAESDFQSHRQAA